MISFRTLLGQMPGLLWWLDFQSCACVDSDGPSRNLLNCRRRPSSVWISGRVTPPENHTRLMLFFFHLPRMPSTSFPHSATPASVHTFSPPPPPPPPPSSLFSRAHAHPHPLVSPPAYQHHVVQCWRLSFFGRPLHSIRVDCVVCLSLQVLCVWHFGDLGFRIHQAAWHPSQLPFHRAFTKGESRSVNLVPYPDTV